MRIKEKYFLFLFIAILVSCKPSAKVSVQSAPTTAPKVARELSEEELINLKFLFVNATKEKMIGNLEKAAEGFAQCIRIDGAHHASMFELAQIYKEQKKYNDAVFFARSAAEADPSNVWYQLFLAELLMGVKKPVEAQNIYARLYSQYPEKVEYGFKYAATLIYNGKLQDAINVYDKIEDRIGINNELIIEKERLYLRLGKVDKAAEELEKLIAEDPRDIRNYSLLVELYQVNNMPEKAFETIGRMQKINAESPYVYLASAEYYRSNNQKEKSFEQLKLAFASNELETELKIRIISSYLPLVEGSPEMLEQGAELSRILAETHPTEAIALAIYGDFLVMKKEFEAAKKQYLLSKEIDDKNFTVWQQLFICYEQTSDWEGLKKITDEALTMFPDQALVYMYNGSALTRLDQHEQAIKILITGNKMVVDHDALLFEFYRLLGDNYNSTKEYPESDKYFEKALKLNPKDPYLLNNYSYYLSERGENLEKAEMMSKLSNELRPDEASFLDTYGWILYKLGKYEDALLWLQKALEHGGNSNGTILEHTGDVYFKTGKIEKAIEYWNKAKATGETSVLIDQKIRDKKLYE